MSKRRSARLQTAMDASFQIPFAVNTTANNLLLEDDTLEHDFFDGLDYTLSTPLPPTRASSSKLILPNLHPRQQEEVLKSVQPEPLNFDRDYDYAQEEQEVEMGNADVGEDTPRRKRVYDSDDRELTPTPRARKHPHGLGRPKRPSLAPTPISRPPELNEDFLRKLHNDESRSAAVHDLPRRSLSASATPKPKKQSRAASRAPPSVHSTPVRATASASSSRSDKGHSRAGSREIEGDKVHHEHASSVPTHSAVPSELESDVDEQLDQAAPVPVRGPIRDPYLPERLLSRPPVSSRARRTSTSQRSRPGSRKRNTSPSHLSRAGHDAVMLPIQEDDEDLQHRGEQPPISKPQQSSGSSVPQEKAITMTKEEGKKKETATASAASSSSTAGASRSKPKAPLSLKAAAKRSEDILASQPAPKKRKTDVNVVRSGSKPTEGETSRTPPIRPNPVTAEMPAEDVRELGKATSPIAKPVAPEANFLPSSPSRHCLIQPPSELPPGNFNMELARQDLSEGPDEVQDFLSRYAKKYGSGSDTAADALPIIPNVPLSAASTQNNSHLQVPVPPKRCDVASEASAPKGKRTQDKARQPAANPDLKGKSKTNDPVPKNGVRKVPPAKVRVARARSVPVQKSGDSGASEKAAQRMEVALDKRRAASQLPSTMTVDEPPAVPSPRLISSASQECEIVPPTDQMIIDEPPAQPFEARSDIATSCFASTGSYDTEEGQVVGSRALEDPVLAFSTSAPSVIPEPPAARSEPKAPKGTINSAFIGEKRSAEQTDSCDRRLAGGQPPKKPSVSSVPQALKRKASVEPRTDDMFARKKRDNYLQKGLDLTAHSSRRYTEKAAPGTQIEFSRAASHETARQIAEPSTSTAESIDSKFGNTITSTSQSVASVSDLPAGKRDQKAKAGARSDLEWKDRPYGKTRRELYKDDSSKRHGKQAAKSGLQTSGVGDQKVKATLSESNRGQVGRQSESGLVDAGNTSTGSIGNVIAERLVSFSQRIMGSFGLLSSHSQTDAAERSSKAVETSEYASHLPDLEHDHLVSTGARGPGMQQRASPSRLPELSPRKIGQHRVDNDRDEMPIGRDDIDRVGPERRHHAHGLEVHVLEDHNYAGNPGPSAPFVSEHLGPEVADDTSRPLRKSRERPAGGEPQEAGERDIAADNDIELSANDRSRKRTRLLRDESALAAGPAVPSNSSRSDKPRHVMPSSRARAAGVKNGTRGLLASSKNKTKTANARRVPTTRDAEANASNKPSVRPDGTESSSRAKNSCSLTVPMAPAFTSDVLRQQRLLAKSEREHEQREKKDEKKARSDDTIAGNIASNKAPQSDKQPSHHPIKPTVPHTFRFETDTRVINRRQEFEAKLKTWEQRSASSNSQTASRKPLPDFKSLHSAQEAGLANMAARRRELIEPTVPVSPHFVVDIRLAEREKFEEARRTKEKETERLMEEKRRKREEEEEREWREARKRTVPRANAVPEWYAEVPKRTAQSR